MKGNVIRWIAVGLMLAAAALLLAAPSQVEAEAASLPMDYTVGGAEPKAEGWTYDGKVPLSYEDSTISVTVEHGSLTFTPEGNGKKKTKHETFTVRIKIGDVSQLRAAASKDVYKGGGQAKAESMAKSKNAVVAMNGDFFKYENDVGYVVRFGELIRDATDNKRGRIFDMLVIDSEGDFHMVPQAQTESIEAFIAEELEPAGRTILHTYNLGPVLVLDGEVQNISESEAARQGSYQWKYPQQRIALVQTGHLEYAIVEVYGKTDSSAGMTLQQFAEYVAEQCPGAVLAYNLDGGGSTNLVVNNKRICKVPGNRDITDIIYFASAEE